MDTPKICLGKVITYAGVVIAFFIGAGFATGQEIVQYFVAYGVQFPLVLLVVIGLHEYVNWSFIRAGDMGKLSHGSDVFKWYCGKYVGGFYDCFALFYQFLSFIVMVGGAASTGKEQYGWQPWVGGCLLAVLVTATVLLGLQKMVDILGKLGPVIIVLLLFVCSYIMLRDWGNIRVGMEMIQSGEVVVMKIGTNAFAAGISYVGAFLLWCAPFMAELGATNNAREVKWGTVIAYVVIGLVIAVMTLAMIAVVHDIALADIPTLTLAAMISPAFARVLSIIVLAGSYTSAVPLLWMPVARFAREGTPRFRIITILFGVLGLAAALYLPYRRLVNIVFGVGGAIGVLIVLFVGYTDIRILLEKKRQA